MTHLKLLRRVKVKLYEKVLFQRDTYQRLFIIATSILNILVPMYIISCNFSSPFDATVMVCSSGYVLKARRSIYLGERLVQVEDAENDTMMMKQHLLFMHGMFSWFNYRGQKKSFVFWLSSSDFFLLFYNLIATYSGIIST